MGNAVSFPEDTAVPFPYLVPRLCLGNQIQRLCLAWEKGGRASGSALPGRAW